MTFRTRRPSWFVSVLLLVALVLVGKELVVAQPQSGAARPASDASEATFVSLGEHTIVNPNNVAYTSDEGKVFDIYFACSSSRGTDPLRLTREEDKIHARSYFNDENRQGNRFEKYNKYFISTQHIAYVELKDDSVIINFTARISDAFVQLTLFGADAESFRKKRPGF